MDYSSLLNYGKSNEQEPSKKSLRVKKSNGNEEPKKVDKIPEGFTFLKKEGGKTYYTRKTTKPGIELKPSISSKEKADPKKYMIEVENMVKGGANPEDLFKKGYISRDVMIKLTPLYKPKTTEEMVYMEDMQIEPTKPKPKPITAYETENMFGSNAKAIGAALTNTRDSKDFAAQQGAVNPTGQDVWFAFYKPNSTEIDESKGLYKIPANIWDNEISPYKKFDEQTLSKYLYKPNQTTQKMGIEVKQELPFQSTGSTLISPRLR